MVIAEIASQTSPVVTTGVGLGAVIAALCSWERNRSIFWAIVAALLSWVYVVYFILTRRTRRLSTEQHIPTYPLGIKRDRVLRSTASREKL